jgi:hypothetical protein
MTRRILCQCIGWIATVVIALSSGAASAILGPVTPRQISQAITELDVERARALLERTESNAPTIAYERARLAIYVGDCLSAMAILDAPHFRNAPETASLAELARSCAGATAGSPIVEDKKNGIWLRFQDQEDKALMPFLTDVAVRARRRIEADLGVTLPRPLRLDLVRDLFSLSAISGLPVTAAETTGTVAVARWGRVTMISPRATPLGYPWEDTLAHEITHLALSRATRDKAPLWLQEGVAKREERRWRAERPFDDAGGADLLARQALKSGRAVGIDQLGPSIAMLPTPEQASTAFAEVTSFVDYWIRENGTAALALLLLDLKGIEGDSADAALRSVSGFGLTGWKFLWEQQLLKAEPVVKAERATRGAEHGGARDVVRHARLGDLLFARGHSKRAAKHFTFAQDARPNEAALRWRSARALLDSETPEEAEDRLGTQEMIEGPHGGWFGLRGRLFAERGELAKGESAFALGLAYDPLAEDVACEGKWRPRGSRPMADPPLPKDERRRALCEAARKIERD